MVRIPSFILVIITLATAAPNATQIADWNALRQQRMDTWLATKQNTTAECLTDVTTLLQEMRSDLWY